MLFFFLYVNIINLLFIFVEGRKLFVMIGKKKLVIVLKFNENIKCIMIYYYVCC